jgi:Carboxypeptidase regulatory-like domain/TonB-dependent Receptor Plug Domain/TonB dependent receptor
MIAECKEAADGDTKRSVDCRRQEKIRRQNMTRHRPAKKYAFTVLTFASFVVCMLIPIPVCAQVVGATLSGTVTDTSGAVVPKAQVFIQNMSTGISTTVPTNAEGVYAAANVLPGDYEVTVSGAGFKTEARSGVNLTVGAHQVLNITLHVGQTAQKIDVTGAVTTVELASSAVGGVVEATTIEELPLNGRDWTTLAVLEPGVSKVLTQQPNVGNSLGGRGYGQELAISGTRPQLNNYRIDGISVVDYAGGSPGSSLGVALGVDAIEQFSVLTSNASAEYGRTSGGVVNAITRSGTNTIHGSAFWFLRDEGLDARNYFDTTIPPFHRNQFGGSAGGPIQKDKTFFFVDYEGLRENLGTTNINKVPSQDARKGILHNPDGTTTTVTVDPLVAPFLPLFPLPNAGLIGDGDTGLFDIATNAALTENYVTTKIDRKFSTKDSISGTFFRDKASNQSPDNLDTQLVDSPTSGTMIGVEESHLFSPTLMNSVRGGYHRVTAFPEQSVKAINPLAGDLSLGSFPGRFAPSISVTGLDNYNGGLGALSSQGFYWNSIQAYDDAFLTKGTHLIKFGFAFERMQMNNRILPDNGNFSFGSLQSFLTNQPTSFNGAPPNNVSGHGDRQTLLGGYLQDDWRVRHNLTLNLGLRYEMVTVPTEVENKISNLVTFTSPTPKLGSPYFNNPTLRNFEPRVGVAWDPSGSGKTSVRAAFGIFDVLPLIYEFSGAIGTSAPFTEKVAAPGTPGSFPTGIVATIFGSGAPPPTTLRYGSIQVNPPRNYLMLWNLNIQRELTPSTTFMVGYVGNHGVHMLNRADDVNMVLPQATPQGLLWPFPAGSGTILNPVIGDIRGEYWTGTALYDALEVQLTKRMSHGFHVQGSYTWGKNIDTGSASVIGDPFTNSITSPLWFCGACRRGLSDFNIGQTLVVNYVWDLPNPESLGVVASHLLGGWQLGGIITAETGVPFTPLIGGDPLGENSTDPFAYPSRVPGPGCGSPVNPGNPNNYVKLQCFSVPMATPAIAALCTPFSAVPGSCANLFGNAGRNSVIGPGLVTWDFSLVKNTHVKERFNLQFRAEFFNILNKANFGTPVDNSTFFDSGGNPVGGAGALDTTSTTSRQIQLGLKVIF